MADDVIDRLEIEIVASAKGAKRAVKDFINIVDDLDKKCRQGSLANYTAN